MLEADYVVVGSGAAGATAALVLAEAGKDVLVLEEGAWSTAESRRPELLPSLATLYRDAGLQVALGPSPMPILQGRCVGGTTTVNAGILWRFPEETYRAWLEEDPALARALPLEELRRREESLERLLSARPVAEEVTGANDRLMARGAAALGIEGHAIRRNEEGCEGTGRCIQGCPRARKRAMDASFLPRAIARGARVVAGVRARRVTIEGGRASGVEVERTGEVEGACPGRGNPSPTPPAEGSSDVRSVRARRAVLLAASAVQTPCLLRRSGLAGLAGERFACHPGVAMLGVFDEPVRAWQGATQAWETGAFRSRRFKLEALGLPPELLAARLPGGGAAFGRALDSMDRVACWAAQVRSDALGTVRPSGRSGARILFSPSARDAEAAADALSVLARMMVAAGAREVLPGVAGVPERVPAQEVERVLDARRLPRDAAAYSFVATHLFGTARMATDRRAGVVRPGDLRCHDVEALHVVDSSVFPSNLGVNPQLAIMAVAAGAAERIAG